MLCCSLAEEKQQNFISNEKETAKLKIIILGRNVQKKTPIKCYILFAEKFSVTFFLTEKILGVVYECNVDY